VLQILNPIDYRQLAPRYDWIKYNEPEDHLDDVCKSIEEIMGPIKDLSFGGITYKDDTTLERTKRIGALQIWRIDPHKDLGIRKKMFNIESIQERIRTRRVEQIKNKYGLADVLLVRHIFEHTHHTIDFSNSLKRMIKPDGLLIIEVPDCSAGIDYLDYSILWEEHTYYFTPKTLARSLEILGYEIVKFQCYEYPHENSLVAFARPIKNKKPKGFTNGVFQNELYGLQRFADNFSDKKKILNKKLNMFRLSYGNIAIFGGGHLSCMFINILDCASEIKCVIDDDPMKQHLYMPGSKVKILSSKSLYDFNIRLCLMAVSSASEKNIVNNNPEFTSKGGIFTSIFPQNSNNIFNIHL